MTAGGNLASGGVTIVGVGQTLNITQYLNSAVVAADVGKVVKFSANNTVNLAADGEEIHGVLKSYEDRVMEDVKTGTVGFNGGYRFTYKTSDTVAVGDSVVSAGGGEVKKSTLRMGNIVVAKDTVNRTVDVLLGYHAKDTIA